MKLPPPYPLAWPETCPRTANPKPGSGVGPRAAFNRLFSQLLRHTHPKRFRITSNLQVDSEGAPLEYQAAPTDPGVCVYFASGIAFPFDVYSTAPMNLWGLADFLTAFEKAIKAAPPSYLEKLQSGFLVPAKAPTWVGVLFGRGARVPADPEAVERQFKILSKELHPDRGGSPERYRQIVLARAAARKWYEARKRNDD